MKDKIRKFVLDQGIDDVGFAAVSEYKSPQSPKIETLFPEAKTIVVACVKEMSHVVSQPCGLAKIIGFWMQWAGKSPDEQKKMLFTKDFFMTYQASFIGFQYFCFKCYSSCPVGSE